MVLSEERYGDTATIWRLGRKSVAWTQSQIVMFQLLQLGMRSFGALATAGRAHKALTIPKRVGSICSISDRQVPNFAKSGTNRPENGSQKT